MGPERRAAFAIIMGLGALALLLTVFPNGIPALEAVGRFVDRPAVGILVVFAALGPAGIHLMRRGGAGPPKS